MRPLVREHVTLGDLVLTSRDDAAGVTWVMGNLTGWGSPGSTIATKQRPRGHGVWAGDAFLAARTVSMSGWLRGDTPEAADAAVDQLIGAVGLDEGPLVVTSGAQQRVCMVRRQGEVVVKRLTDWALAWSIQVVATDPRKFGDTITASTALPSTTGGLTVPFTVPFTIDAVTVTGQVSLTNPGNIAGPVRLRIDGPVQGPVVTHVSSGRSLVFASSVVLGAGEWIEVDMERREVLANGQSSRNGWVTQRGWSQFEPGDNTWAFTAAGYNAASLLTVEAVPAWM